MLAREGRAQHLAMIPTFGILSIADAASRLQYRRNAAWDGPASGDPGFVNAQRFG